MKRLGLPAFALAILYGAGAFAQDVNEGVVNAVAYRPLPPADALTLEVMDDAARSLTALAEFQARLRTAGYRLAAAAPLILTVEVRDVHGAWSDGGRRTLMEFEASGDSATGQNQKLRFNLYESNTGGIFNEGRTVGGTSIVSRARYRIEASLGERDGGRRLWQGWAEVGTERQDEDALIRAMVVSLVSRIGATARHETFPLP